MEKIDPISEEESRERLRNLERNKSPTSVGYTVAQYGEPGTVDRSTPSRHFGDTLERRTPEVTAEKTGRTSPEYATVYERFERTTEWREEKKSPRQVDVPVISPYKKEDPRKPDREASPSPPPPPASHHPEREPSPDYGGVPSTRVRRISTALDHSLIEIRQSAGHHRYYDYSSHHW